MRRTKPETIKPIYNFQHQFLPCGRADHQNHPGAHQLARVDQKVLITGDNFAMKTSWNIQYSICFRQKTIETARLSESMSQLSVNDEKSNPRPLGLSQDQVNRLQAEAGMCATQPPQSSAMDRYMEMKTKQELDNITCNH